MAQGRNKGSRVWEITNTEGGRSDEKMDGSGSEKSS